MTILYEWYVAFMKSYIQYMMDKNKRKTHAWYIKNSNIPVSKTMLCDPNIGIGMTEHSHLSVVYATGLPSSSLHL